jgi:hypothetical protein
LEYKEVKQNGILEMCPISWGKGTWLGLGWNFKYEIQIWTRSVDEMLYTMARILTKKW